MLEANGPSIRDLKLFTLNFSEETLRETVNIMSEKRFTPGDLIFPKNDIDNKSLFIIRKGEIELFYENDGELNSMRKLGVGEIFGEMSFFSNQRRAFFARSLDFSNVFMINQEEFLSILRKNKKDFERFCQIKDNINLYKDYGDLYLKCFSCLESCHRIKDCPILHYMPKKEIVVLRHLYSLDQTRAKWKRKSKKSSNAFASLSTIKKKDYKFENAFLINHESSSSEEYDNYDKKCVLEGVEKNECIEEIKESEEN